MGNTVIVDACRTPRGQGRRALQGELSGVHPQELIATCLRALDERNPNFDPAMVEDVCMGAVMSFRAVEIDGTLKPKGSENNCDIARWGVLVAGWPEHVPGVTLHRHCGSGLQTINFAHGMIASGQQEVVVAGGVESMSRNPIVGLRDPEEPNPFRDYYGYNDELPGKFHLVPQGVSADALATLEGFTREETDQFGFWSQQKCKVALEEGRFDGRGMVPVKDKEGNVILDHEAYPRPDTTLEKLAELKPAFEKMGAFFDHEALAAYPELERVNHVHTPGTSSGLVDAAAAALLMDERKAKELGVGIRARIRGTAVTAGEPMIMLTQPGPAALKALEKAGMTVADIDLFEINEAFAAVPMKTMRDLDIDPAKVNVNGGAIALGHPIGGTGAVLFSTALDEIERQDLNTALIVLCTGGSMAVATIIERS